MYWNKTVSKFSLSSLHFLLFFTRLCIIPLLHLTNCFLSSSNFHSVPPNFRLLISSFSFSYLSSPSSLNSFPSFCPSIHCYIEAVMLPSLLLSLSQSNILIIYLYRNRSFIAVFTKADLLLAYLFLYMCIQWFTTHFPYFLDWLYAWQSRSHSQGLQIYFYLTIKE